MHDEPKLLRKGGDGGAPLSTGVSERQKKTPEKIG